jgi:hypothetical protein
VIGFLGHWLPCTRVVVAKKAWKSAGSLTRYATAGGPLSQTNAAQGAGSKPSAAAMANRSDAKFHLVAPIDAPLFRQDGAEFTALPLHELR